jgi:hypothetical protein
MTKQDLGVSVVPPPRAGLRQSVRPLVRLALLSIVGASALTAMALSFITATCR